MSSRMVVVVRAVLMLLGVAATSLLLLLSATEVSIATQGERTAPWAALVLFVGAMVLGWLTVWAAAARNPLGRASRSARMRRRLAALAALTATPLVGTTIVLTQMPSNPNVGAGVVLPFLLAWGCDAVVILGALCVLSLRGV